MNNFKKLSSILLSMILIIICFFAEPTYAKSSDNYYIIISQYYENLNIGDEFFLIAFVSNGKSPSFKSSDSKIVSVNSYGLVKAKRAGSATITAYKGSAYATCLITVNPTSITLNSYSLSLENGKSFKLSAKCSSKSLIKWKSSKSSVASVDSSGLVTAKKPGTALISATADGYTKQCSVTVKSPTISLNMSNISCYRCDVSYLTATTSSGLAPKWKSNRSSVATVDSSGKVTAIKNGTAIISATLDGVTATCNVTVKKPQITLDCYELSIKNGCSKKLIATVSSKNIPTFTSSNLAVATVSQTGCISARKKGIAYITVTEDGTKIKCKVIVTD